jgi:hypothetical protein
MGILVTVEFADSGSKNGRRRVFAVERDGGQPSSGDIGLTLAEGRQLLKSIQFVFVGAEAEEIVDKARVCVRCGGRLAMKDVERRRVHTLFGRIALLATRWISCGCDGSRRAAFSPLRGGFAPLRSPT